MKAAVFFLLVILFSYAVGLWLSAEGDTDKQQTIYISSCNPAKSTCEFEYKEGQYSLTFKNMPSALSPFLVVFKAAGRQPVTVELNFEMLGMEMGFNNHPLKKNNFNWQEKVILPLCSVSRNDWLLNLKMTFEDTVRISKFSFSTSKE